jgi:hypothetical protein
MSADLTTVVVAILGAVGTLSSPLLTQRFADRAKRQDFEFELERRREDRHEDDRRSAAEERREIYAQLNTAARRYEQAIYQYLRAISEGPARPDQQAKLVAARETFRELYSDAQMILPDRVLAAAMDMSYGLGQAYGTPPSGHGQPGRTGRDSRPFMRLTGRQRSSAAGTARESPGRRASRAPRATSASIRARGAPRQWCTP